MNVKYQLPIENIINRLGYQSSANLYRFDNLGDISTSSHILKVLTEIQPYAVYLLDGKPFILFFDKSFDNASSKRISKLVWNAQISIAFFCDDNSVKIYNGTSLNMESYLLNKVTETNIESCSMYSEFSYWEISNPIFWNKYIYNYSSNKLNEYLLSNIQFMTETLQNKYSISFAIKLVLRIIFIRYLIDRDVDLSYPNFSNDLETLKKEFNKDPKTLSSFTLPNLKGINLVVSDFFDEEKLLILSKEQFDFIIANPPWVM